MKLIDMIYKNQSILFPLSGKIADGKYMIIDILDVPILHKHSWHLSPQGYPRAKIHTKTITVSRFLLNIKNKLQGDHINRNPLDNRRVNLRVVTPSENMKNRCSWSKYWNWKNIRDYRRLNNKEN